mmetsp:Transcript_22065/g.33102  ORF Transcript_22065/g.33102 Transcript_22065/m.33102 type:complete len:120 (-) Transcript_22065:334-693(-)
MHVAITLAFASSGVSYNLAAQNVAKEGKGVVELLVVDTRVQILDEDVAYVAATEAGIALGPHDAARSGFDHGVIHCVQCALGVCQLVEIHVTVAQGSARNSIAAYADAGNRSHSVEDFE